MRKRRGVLFAAFLAPAVLVYTGFVVLPMLLAVPLSGTAWTGQGPLVWIGLDNWSRLFADPATQKSVVLTIATMVLSWAIQIGVALPLGMWLAAPGRTRAAAGVIFMLPMLFSGTAIAIGFAGMLEPNFGLFRGIPLLSHPWLSDVNTALIVVNFVLSWQYIPFYALLFQAGVRQIPASLYEAAELDGASAGQRRRFITIPLLKPTAAVSSMMILVGSLTYFAAFLVMTNGGPGDSTRVLALHMFLKGFREFQLGYANAIALVLMLVGIALALVIVRITGFGSMRSQFEGM